MDWWVISCTLARKPADVKQKLVKGSISDTDEDGDHEKNEKNKDDDEHNNESFIAADSEYAEAVEKAAKWVQKTLAINELNSLWYERLAETHSGDAAIDAFKKAISLDNPGWQAFKGLAEAYFHQGDTASAAFEMEKAVVMLRDIQGAGAMNRDFLIENLIELGEWNAALNKPEEAIKNFQEVLDVNSEKTEAHFQILKVLLTAGLEEQARERISTMSQKAEDSDLTLLSAVFQSLISTSTRGGTEEIFGLLFSITQTTPLFSTLLENMEQAIEYAKKTEQAYDQAVLLLYKGIAIYHYDKREHRTTELALTIWEECKALNSKNYGETRRLQDVHSRAGKLIATYHFHEARSSPNPTSHVEKLEKMVARPFRIGSTDEHIRSYLGCYYTLAGDLARAKKVFLEDMKSALAMLYDDTDDNDSQGFYRLADILMHCGDELNALSAWSLLGPKDESVEARILDFPEEPQRTMAHHLITSVHDRCEADAPLPEICDALRKEIEILSSKLNEAPELEENVSHLAALDNIRAKMTELEALAAENSKEAIPAPPTERTGGLYNTCDGRVCGTYWTYANDFYCCKICPDVQFCKDCLEQLQNGNLKRFVCNPKHDWLHVPIWDDKEFAEVRRGKVKIHGEMKDGKRVGGEVVAVEEWLNVLKDEWEIPRNADLGPVRARNTDLPSCLTQ